MSVFDGRALRLRSAAAFAIIAALIGGAAALLGPTVALLAGLGGYCAVVAVPIALRYPGHLLGVALGVLSTPVIIYSSRVASTALVGGFVILLLLPTAVHIARHRTLRPRTALWGIIILLLTINIVSLLYGLLRGNSLYTAFGDLYLPLEFAGFFFFSALWIRDEKQLRFILLIVMSASVLRLVWELGLFLLGGEFQWEAGQSRILLSGRVFTRPVDFLTLVQFPFAVSLFLIDKRRVIRYVSGAFSILCLLMITLSFSRSFWAAAALSVLALLLLTGNLKLNFRLLRASVLLLLGGVAFLFLLTRVGPLEGTDFLDLLNERLSFTWTQIFNPRDRLEARRGDEIGEVLRTVSEVPFLGVGLGGTYQSNIGKSVGTLEDARVNYVHNFYAQTLLLSGAMGLLSFLWTGGIMLRIMVRTYRGSRDSTLQTAITGGTFGALIAVAVAILTLPLLTKSHAFAHIGAAMGAVSALSVPPSATKRLGQ